MKRTIHTLCDQLHFSNGHGYCATAISEVTLFRAAHHEAACPLLYDRGLVFIFQGFKIGAMAGREFRTGGDRYLILCNAQAVRCETLATSEEPLLGLHIGIDLLELQRLLQVLRDERRRTHESRIVPERPLVSAKLNEDIQQVVDELIETLHDVCASKALGSSCLTRLYFSVLKSEDGRVLEALALADSKLARISAAMRHMEAHLNQKISMEELADIASMSLSAFHRIFREVTGETPLQYLKQLRLSTARNLMAFHGKTASVAAQSVGYESANQFSREFKRYFGLPPSRVAELPYATLQGMG
ncbi:MAG: AraC family transcriptional regulator [Candidatus Competibacteraceae bacterium]|nr:AraC family transcriptional regulator [Candidatus Competibacteraceae bacterium]